MAKKNERIQIKIKSQKSTKDILVQFYLESARMIRENQKKDRKIIIKKFDDIVNNYSKIFDDIDGRTQVEKLEFELPKNLYEIIARLNPKIKQ